MSQSKDSIFLSREGKVFGPVSREKLQQMRQSREIYQYAWLWEGGPSGWSAIHDMPPLPIVRSVAGSRPASAHAGAQGGRSLQAICHDFHHVIGGGVDMSGPDTSILSAFDPSFDACPFRRGQRLWVNLLDPASGRSENASALLESFSHREGTWEYHLKWDKLPGLFSEV